MVVTMLLRLRAMVACAAMAPVALVRGLVEWPREVLLVRAHNHWIGGLVLAGLGIPALFGCRVPLVPAVIVTVIGGTSLLLDLIGQVAHVAWLRGRIWQAIECPVCGSDDGWGGPEDEDDGPDLPDDPHALTLADHEWLRSLSIEPVGAPEGRC